MARNPKDVAVSYYHLSRLARNIDYCGDFEAFWEYFTQDLSKFMGKQKSTLSQWFSSSLVAILGPHKRGLVGKDQQQLMFFVLRGFI